MQVQRPVISFGSVEIKTQDPKNVQVFDGMCRKTHNFSSSNIIRDQDKSGTGESISIENDDPGKELAAYGALLHAGVEGVSYKPSVNYGSRYPVEKRINEGTTMYSALV